MHASQGRHRWNDSSTQSRATARPIPNNSPPQQQQGRANTTLESGNTPIKKASDKIQSLLDASSIRNYRGASISYYELMQLAEWLQSSEP